jgi:predicted GNAT superfamily acetyltransferase
VNPSIERDGRLLPGSADVWCDTPRILVEIPMGFDKMLVNDPALAVEWRHSTRLTFESYFQKGYRAVDFLLSRPARRGQYLLSVPVP